ncbi:hypothetical protein OBK24_01495 [Empedobacter falsenii]|uniref:hypothetical protein n=1 Tax=Algoriella xinjiangensis TaxID=684065 RepID=UPI000F63B0F3|nr:hypothetical protein [Algoriella xinjiangensis]VDH16680.1 Uncharacterised protein [Algoriella xinjiangensis]
MENQDKKIGELSVGLLKVLNEKTEQLISSISKVEEIVLQQNESVLQQSKEFEVKISQLSNLTKNIEVPEIKLPHEYQHFINRIEIKTTELKSILKKNRINTKILIVGFLLCIIGFLSLFYAYSVVFQTKNEIIEEYESKLTQEKRLLTENERIKYQKILKWIEKNPNDSKKLKESIN